MAGIATISVERLIRDLDKEPDISCKRHQVYENSETFAVEVDGRFIEVLIKPVGETMTSFRGHFATMTSIFPGSRSVSSDWFEFNSKWLYEDIKKHFIRRLREIRKEHGDKFDRKKRRK